MKRFKKVLLFVFTVIVAYLIYYCWNAFPVLTGYSAKMACSCIFVGDRTLASVETEELGNFPLKLASIQLRDDSTVEASVAGMARQTALYRPGLGCTLVNELSLKEIRNQKWVIPNRPLVNPDTIVWPMGDHVEVENKIRKAIQFAFRNENDNQPVRTRAVVVLHKGKLVGEQYAPGYDRHHRHLGWSMAKSVTGTLIGILVKEGKLKLDEPANVPEWKNARDGRETITLRQILQQTTGLAFEENYSKATDATNMLFRKADMAAYAASHPAGDKAGERFYYSSGNTNILSGILRRSLGDSVYHRYPYEALFFKLGMYSAVMEPDASGNFVGSSYVWANARDWARLGQLYLQNGNWIGEQLLPEDWVKMATRPVSVAPQGEYGFQIWLNAGKPVGGPNRKFPLLPAEMYYFNGYQGQQVTVIPSKEIVIVRLGQTADSRWFDTQTFINGILEVLD